MAKRILVTGSSGLIGSEVCTWFYRKGWQVHGIDNNQRAVFFGPGGDTRWNQARLNGRLWFTGTGLATLLGILAVVYGGLLADRASEGKRRGRLIFSAVAAVALIVFVAIAVLSKVC